jgi:hypothetical protein
MENKMISSSQLSWTKCHYLRRVFISFIYFYIQGLVQHMISLLHKGRLLTNNIML